MTICDTLADGHFGRRADMAMAFAEILNEEALELEAAGVDVIQFDEPAFNVFMDDVKDWGIATLERAARGLKCATAVHICYGYGIEANIKWKETLGAEWRQYEEIFPAINASSIQQVSLECANSHVPISLLELLPDKVLLVGAIDVASTTVETPEKVAATIEQALKHADAERIQPCTNCGMARCRARWRSASSRRSARALRWQDRATPPGMSPKAADPAGRPPRLARPVFPRDHPHSLGLRLIGSAPISPGKQA